MVRARCLVLLIISLFSSSSASALTPREEQAKSLFVHLEELLKTSPQADPFWKTFRDLAGLSAVDCFDYLLELPDRESIMKHLSKLGLGEARISSVLGRGFESTGGYSLMKKPELEKLCSIAAENGFKPFCSEGNPFTDSAGNRRHKYPLNYLVLRAGEKTHITIPLECSVSFREMKTNGGSAVSYAPAQRIFVKPATIELFESPAIQNWSEASGGRIEILAATSGSGAKTGILLPDRSVANDVWNTSLRVKLRQLPRTFIWTVVVEP